MRAFLASFAFLGTSASIASAQSPLAAPRLLPAQSPFLFVKLLPPAGWTASLPCGAGRTPHTGADPVGLRPGYGYRGKLRKDDIQLFPTIEVIGTPIMPPDCKPDRHVAAITWTGDELDQAAAGKLVSKILYIEDPEQASPIPSSTDSPIITVAEPGEDILRLALKKGRPVARVTIGSRSVEDRDWELSTVAGTVWRVGKEAPSAPLSPPYIPLCPPQADPLHGPACPQHEIVRDGGDKYPRATIGAQAQAVGVDTEDSVAEFTGFKGRRRVIPSNRVCLYMPRFCWVTQQTAIGSVDHQTGPAGATMSLGINRIDLRQPSLATVSETRINGLRSRLRPGGLDLTQYAGRVVKLQVLQGQDLVQTPKANVADRGPDAVKDRQRPQATSAEDRLVTKVGGVGIQQLMSETKAVALARSEAGPKVVSSQVVAREARSDCKEDMVILDQPMVLHKSADRQVAIPGDVVTFTLRFSNMTGRPLTDVAIVDNLSPRLEFVEGSARSNKEAVFTVQENDAGSLILRWEVGTLAPGENALVRFQAKVR